MNIVCLELRTRDRPGHECILIGIDTRTYTLARKKGSEHGFQVIAETPLTPILKALPFTRPEAASRVYARLPGVRAFLTAHLPEHALWITVPAGIIILERERSSHWWGNGLVDRSAVVTVNRGWNPHVGGKRILKHLVTEGRILKDGERIRLTWEERSTTQREPRARRCSAWLWNEGGQARFGAPVRVPIA